MPWPTWPCRCAAWNSGGTRSKSCSATRKARPMSETRSAAGVIHDLGYRRYDGPRLGRAQIVRALTWHSFRSAFGIGRGVKAKIIPALACIAMLLPAFVNAFAVARANPRLFGYDVYTPQLRVIVVTIFIAAQAPELVSRDLRSHVLPLYFSRPIRRGDYPLAKYIALTAALLLLIEVPLLVTYVGTIASAGSAGTTVLKETRALIPGLGVGLMWAVLMAAIGLVLASLTGRRAYATGIVAIACFLTWTVSEVLIWLGGTSPGEDANPGHFGPLYGVVALLLLAACLGGLAARYRKVSRA